MSDVENEILQCIEEYLKEYADDYQRIVVEGGMFGDSIEFTAGYGFMKELMNCIKKQYQEIERLNNIINETKKILLLNFDTTTTLFKALDKLNELKENS